MNYAKKSLGQNFLIDQNVIKKIVNLKKITNKNILEIGPGKGALTNEILKKNPKSLILVEKDNIISKQLQLKYKDNKKVIIYNQDILKFKLENKLQEDSIIFGNLPYNISSQILAKLIKFESWPPKFSDLIFMFQKELAERIMGKFNTTHYGRLSILTDYRLNIFDKFIVSPNCFFPKPNIQSMIINFKPKKKLFSKIKHIENLEKITNILFSNKRKMINKNINKIFKNKKSAFIENLDLKLRPSELNPEIIYKITEEFEKI